MWIDGQVNELMRKCEVIQKRLSNMSKNKDSNFETFFCRFVLQGRLTSATRLLENSTSKGVLAMTPENIETLKYKHPPAAPAFNESLLFGPIQDVP